MDIVVPQEQKPLTTTARVHDFIERILEVDFNWNGKMGLPVRHDSVIYMRDLVFSVEHEGYWDGLELEGGQLDPSCGVPSVQFAGKTGRRVALAFPCFGIVRYLQKFPQTAIDRKPVGGVLDGIIRAFESDSPEWIKLESILQSWAKSALTLPGQ